MQIPWEHIFDNWGEKIVSKTDKKKTAYLPNRDQQVALEAAGIAPSKERPGDPLTLSILFDPEVSRVTASYYYSARSPQAARRPEPRMGQEFINSWADEGDLVVIGNIGSRLFAAKVGKAAPDAIGHVLAVAGKSNQKTIIELAKKAKGKPRQIVRKQTVFVRNPNVVAGALIRARGRCELPGCMTALFRRDDGQPFLEVHHIVPLAEDGVDELGNAATLCPMCHRELHFGRDRLKKRGKLGAAIAAKPI